MQIGDMNPPDYSTWTEVIHNNSWTATYDGYLWFIGYNSEVTKAVYINGKEVGRSSGTIVGSGGFAGQFKAGDVVSTNVSGGGNMQCWACKPLPAKTFAELTMRVFRCVAKL